jgi:hypothetical protein
VLVHEDDPSMEFILLAFVNKLTGEKFGGKPDHKIINFDNDYATLTHYCAISRVDLI